MSRRIRFLKLFAVIALILGGLVNATIAFAASGQFRYSHNEPLNDLRVTPGARFNVTVASICRSGYSKSVRDVPESEKKVIYLEYGIAQHTTDQFEIDHLIPLELGGNNSIPNLWPELNDHPKGYLNSKDILENRLHDLVCTGAVTLQSAQAQIATNWVLTFFRYFDKWPSGGAPTSTSTTIPVPTSTTSISVQATTTTTTAPVTSTTVVTTSTTVTVTSGVTITSFISAIAPGGHDSLTAHSTMPDDSCTLEVTLPSGRRSTESGLGTTTANASGDVTWTWSIGSNTDAGTAHFSVTCTAGVANGTFTIT
jgi:hypothetical protein